MIVNKFMLKTKISPVLERVISTQIKTSLSKKPFTKYEFMCDQHEFILKDIDLFISQYASILFVRECLDGRDTYSLAFTRDAFKLIRMMANSDDVIGFIWHNGAITISSDLTQDEIGREIRLTCWGSIIPYADDLVGRFSGVKY